MYHDVAVSPADVWAVTPNELASHMEHLREEGYTSIRPDQLRDYFNDEGSLPDKPVMITFDDGYLSLQTFVEPILQSNGFQAVSFLITDYIADGSEPRRRFEGKPCLTWPEVRKLHERGTIIFGGHSASHARLTDCDDPTREMDLCLRAIRDHLEAEPQGFCYPYGASTRDVERAARRLGIQTAFTAKDKLATIKSKRELLALPRLWMSGGVHSNVLARLSASGN